MDEVGEPQDEQDNIQTQTLALFDLLWFRRLILLSNHPPPPPPPGPPPPPPPQVKPELFLLRRRSIHRRHHSDDMTSSCPSLKIQPPKLQTILSGKETESFETHVKKERRRWRRRKKKMGESSSKSLSDLEFEELKGFMDLGFTFSDAESDPRLRKIVPGLQRLKMAAGTEEFQEVAGGGDDVADEEVVVVARPYLSEAWELEEEEEEKRLRGLKIRMGGSEVDLKDQLRFWAQAVASTVQ